MGPTIRHFIQSWYNFHTNAASDKYYLWVGQVCSLWSWSKFCICHILHLLSAQVLSAFLIAIFPIFTNESTLKQDPIVFHFFLVWKIDWATMRAGVSGLKSACFIPRQPRSRILMSLGGELQGREAAVTFPTGKITKKKAATTFVWIGNKNIYSSNCQGVKVG